MSRSLNHLEEYKTREIVDRYAKPLVQQYSRIPYVPTSRLPSSVVQHYAKYKNPNAFMKRKVVGSSIFEIDDHYEVLDVIGQGAYGIVVSAIDRKAPKEKSKVAIKKIEKAFEHKIFTKRTLRELKICRLLRHENVSGIRTLLLPRSREEFEDLYVCSPLMETDLASIIKSQQSLTDDHVQFFIYQVLRGLKYIHSGGIIHRDLKPRNLLVNSNCDLKICDFGLARATHCIDEPGKMTDYVATRWYRAPELLLEIKEYGPGVDIWSVGCILAELVKRKPFLPGSDTRNQLDRIFDIFGTPTEEFISTVPKPGLRKFLRTLYPRQPRPLETVFAKTNPLAIDLIGKMMALDPKKRITVNEALAHPYLKNFHCLKDEPTREPVPSVEFEFERYRLSLQQLKDLIYEEILLYHFEDFRNDYFKKVKIGENPFKEVVYNANSLRPGQFEPGDEMM